MLKRTDNAQNIHFAKNSIHKYGVFPGGDINVYCIMYYVKIALLLKQHKNDLEVRFTEKHKKNMGFSLGGT